MTREFITTTYFEKNWADMSLNDDDLLLLENYLMANPKSGDRIQGTGGAMKLR